VTEQEREELIEKIAQEFSRYNYDTPWPFFIPEARAALAVAEPVIREQCARIADKTRYAFDVKKDMNTIAAAIREGGE
jgi:alkylhydroperoxidase family enzyme